MKTSNSVLIYTPDCGQHDAGDISFRANDVLHHIGELSLVDPVYTVEKLQYPYPVQGRWPFPENKERLNTCYEALLRFDLIGSAGGQLALVEPQVASESEITTVHSRDYIRQVVALSKTGGELGEAVYLGKNSYEAALLSAGGGITAAQLLHDGRFSNALVLTRPPGHHAGKTNGAGFCIFNNVAIAARQCQALGWRKVLIVDWDLHHGDGTQAIFYDDPTVAFCSLHQFGPELYPEKGDFDEIGNGAGRGYSLNLPLPAKVDDESYLPLFEHVVKRLAKQFRPDIILVSAGYDGHFNDTIHPYVWDPGGGLALSAQSYARLTEIIAECAANYCQGRYIVLLEGGYNLQALANGVINTAAAMLGHGAVVTEKIPPTLPVTKLDIPAYLQKLAKFHPWL